MSSSDDAKYVELMDAVIAVAAFPPRKGRNTTYAAQVPWKHINRLRDALDAAGIGWREA